MLKSNVGKFDAWDGFLHVIMKKYIINIRYYKIKDIKRYANYTKIFLHGFKNWFGLAGFDPDVYIT